MRLILIKLLKNWKNKLGEDLLIIKVLFFRSVKMSKKTLRVLYYIAWIIGSIAVILLVYGIIRTILA